jgi:hypothetical protein
VDARCGNGAQPIYIRTAVGIAEPPRSCCDAAKRASVRPEGRPQNTTGRFARTTPVLRAAPSPPVQFGSRGVRFVPLADGIHHRSAWFDQRAPGGIPRNLVPASTKPPVEMQTFFPCSNLIRPGQTKDRLRKMAHHGDFYSYACLKSPIFESAAAINEKDPM